MTVHRHTAEGMLAQPHEQDGPSVWIVWQVRHPDSSRCGSGNEKAPAVSGL